MRDEATDETLAAPSSTGPKLAQGTTGGSDPTMNANLVPAGQVTRASSPSLAETVATDPTDHDALPIVEPSNYQIIKELARGGMGRILEARDLRLGRPIAIKEVLHGDEGARLRFDREVRITAGLQHPAIVHVTEAGRWPNGQPFFAMKLIRGKPLDQRIAAADGLTERLALLPAVIAVTDALAYAHSKSVIHRDLKPANVLVGDFGETVVIDWGIAKDLAEQEEIVSLTPRPRTPWSGPSNSGETVEGSVMGTPSYMPPEQAQGDRVDARADVYALGAMLYQVLAGVPPFVGRTTAEVLAKVLTDKPEPLATVVPDAPVDLIAVVEKAMARDPAQRFPTANEMVVELKRFQQGKLVASHDYTTWQLTKRWFNRNRGAVLVGAIAIVTLAVLGVIGISRILVESRRADLEATAARARADAGLISDARNAMTTDPTRAVAILKHLSPGTGELRAARMIAADAASAGVAHVLTGKGAIEHLVFSPDGRAVLSYEVPGNTLRVWDLATLTGRTIGGAPDLVAIELTSSAALGVDTYGRLWRWPLTPAAMPAPPTLVRTIPGKYGLGVFSPDGTRLLLWGQRVVDTDVRSTFESYLLQVDLAGGQRELGTYRNAAWDPDGRSLITYDQSNHVVHRIDAATGDVLASWQGIYARAFATDGKRVWVAGDVTSALNTDVIRELTGKLRATIDITVTRLEALPDGRVVGASAMRRMRLDAELVRGAIKGMSVPFMPDDMSTGDHALVVSDGWNGSVSRLRGHAAPVLTLAVGRDGMIASGDSNGEIRLWQLPVVIRDHGDGHTTSTFAMMTPERQLVVTRRGPRIDVHDVAGRTHTIEVTEVMPGITRDMESVIERNSFIGSRFIRESSKGSDDEVVELARSANGRHVATVDSSQRVVVWDLTAKRAKMLAEQVKHVAIDATGERIVTSRIVGDKDSSNRVVELWDVATGKATVLNERKPTAMMFGPGDRLAIAGVDGVLYVYEAGKLRVLDLPQQNYRALAFSADGTMLYAGSDNWVIEAVDLLPGSTRSRTLLGHTGTIVALTLDPRGDRLFSAGADQSVRVWNLADGSSAALRGHTGLVTSIELGEDETLITAADDRTARIWDLQTHDSRPLVGHEDRVLFAAHVAGGQRIVVVDRFHQIAEYPDNLPHDAHLLRVWLAAATNLE